MSFENFQKFLKQYNVKYEQNDFNDMKLWLAQEGILELSDRENLAEAKSYIAVDKLLSSLRQTCKALHIPVTAPKNSNLTF